MEFQFLFWCFVVSFWSCKTYNFFWVPIPSMLSQKHWEVRGPIISPKYPQQCQTVYPILLPQKQLLHGLTQSSIVGQMEEWLKPLLLLTRGWTNIFAPNKPTQIHLSLFEWLLNYRPHWSVILVILSGLCPQVQLEILLETFHFSCTSFLTKSANCKV